MSDPFVHLHCHSTYSWLDGFGHPAQYAARAKELGQSAIAVTDHGNISAHKKWSDECSKVGVKPILGLEAYVCDNSSVKAKGDRRWHVTLLAKNEIGYKNLIKLTTHSWEPEHFYYKPRIDFEVLRAHSAGLIATSGCPSGRIGSGVTKENWSQKEVQQELLRQRALFDEGCYYAELSPWNYEGGRAVARNVYKAALETDTPLVLTMDAHYPRPENAHIQQVMVCINQDVKWNDPNRLKFDQDDFCIWSGEDMANKWHGLFGRELPLLDQMTLNTKRIADSCSLKFPTATPLRFPYDGDKKELLWHLCQEGMKRRGIVGRPGYAERLKYEYELVLSKDFVDYFLVVADLIVWAKENGILVGPARGSSCGSLMCYAMRITDVDPIPYTLLFERFIDVSRSDMPDIDIDFESERRHEVKEYLENKYGKNHIGNLATFGTFKGKLCLQDIGRVFSDKIPATAVEEIKRLVITRSSADSRAGFAVEDTFTNFEQAAEHLAKYPELGYAKDLEGQIRQLGVHAAGVVVSNEPIDDFAAVYVTKNGDRVLSMDYNDANSIGLLKIDILGLTVLTAMKRIMAMVWDRHGIKIDLARIEMEDAAVYENFCRQNLRGIFQFEGESTMQVCRQVQPRTFEDLVAINALSRPGPLHTGGTTKFIERRFGREEATSLHPMLEPITRATYGITVYQEQVMQIVREMGKFDWKETAAIRKAMSKKLGNEFFDKMKAKFVEGAVSQGVLPDHAADVWQSICTFGAWAFNRSHSVAYSFMAYQLMWLKTHYPEEFYTSMMGCEQDENKRRRLLKEYQNEFKKPLPVCINESKHQATCGPSGLRLGLDAVIGLGEKVAGLIVAGQPYKSYVDFTKRCKCPAGQAEKLLKIGAFRNLEFDSLTEQQDLFGASQSVRQDFDYKNPKDQDVYAYCPLAAENKNDEKWRVWLRGRLGKVHTIRELDEITERRDVIITGRTNPNSQFNLKNKVEEALGRGHEWHAPAGEEKLSKGDFAFLNFNLEDETDMIIVRVHYRDYPRFKQFLWALRPEEFLAVRGMVTGTQRMVFAKDIVSLTAMGARLRAKEPLIDLEEEFMNPEKRRKRRPRKS